MISPEELLTWSTQDRMQYLINQASSEERRNYLVHVAHNYPKDFLIKMSDFFLSTAGSHGTKEEFVEDIEFGLCLKEEANKL